MCMVPPWFGVSGNLMSIGSNATANGYNITYKSAKKEEELDL